MGGAPNPVPPVNIPIPTKIGSKMGGEFTYQPKWNPIGFDDHCQPSQRLGESDVLRRVVRRSPNFVDLRRRAMAGVCMWGGC